MFVPVIEIFWYTAYHWNWEPKFIDDLRLGAVMGAESFVV